MLSVVTVRLLDVPYSADRDYDYRMADGVALPERGRLLLVPFGSSNRPSHAVCVSLRTVPAAERALKEIYAVLPEDYRVTEEILKLCFFLSEHTLCSVGDAVRAAFPVAALGELRETYRVTGSPPPFPKSKKEILLAYLAEHPDATKRALETALGTALVKGTLSSLCKEGLVERVFRESPPASPQFKSFYSLAPTGDARRLLLRGDGPLNEKQRAVCLFLNDVGECTKSELCDRLNISESPLKTLVSRGIVKVEERPFLRNPYEALARTRDASPVALSRAQSVAYSECEAVYQTKKPACVLLHGVTGSGKTKLMIKLLDRALGEGGQAILLVPEIALTPQTVGIFCARYGDKVSVLHSSLSAGERFDAYRKILRGDADLVIGTRSAVFAPLSRLALVLIDEEHEHTYKSDAAPRYHTRDVAAFRSGEHSALTLLASATPSVDSNYTAKTGKYTLVSLTERYGGTLLPVTEIVDMREELRAGNTSPISRRLSEALEETVSDGKQAVLFLNRRGYHKAVSCKGCGEALVCPHCSVSFTYHSGYGGSYLLCHACGTKQPMPSVCPACGGEHLSFIGAGTQKVEAELSREGDGLRVLRMDADTTTEKTAYDRILTRFRRREADVLLGTQMVTKGHDFPAVALSGVILADTSLYTHDYRASERTFSLLTQVIGRAGRAGEVGRAIVQTFSPDNRVITLAAEQNYPAFYEEEIALRRALANPPFCDIAAVHLSGTDEGQLLKLASDAREKLLSLFRYAEGAPAYALYGPLEESSYKVAERYRVKLLVKCRLTPTVRRLFGKFLTEFTREHASLSLTVDFNPTET